MHTVGKVSLGGNDRVFAYLDPFASLRELLGKSWFVMTRLDGKLSRVTIGRHPALSLADAREEARRTIPGAGRCRTSAFKSGRFELERGLLRMTHSGHSVDATKDEFGSTHTSAALELVGWEKLRFNRNSIDKRTITLPPDYAG
jgi:hypothetical protein